MSTLSKIFKTLKSEWLFIIALMILYVGFRSVHFADFYSFVNDQSILTYRAMEMWNNNRFSLVGPYVGLGALGRNLILPSTTYYIILGFLKLGNWDAMAGAYAYVLIGSLGLIPLYFGTKKIAGVMGAQIMCLVFALLPYYNFYSRDFFNPSFLLSVTPIAIYFLGKAYETKRTVWYFALAVQLGIMTTLHVQVLPICALLFAFVTTQFFRKRTSVSRVIYTFIGLIVGLSPFILIELKNNFYNLQTLIFIFQHLKDRAGNSTNLTNVNYIYTALSVFLLITMLFSVRKKLKNIHVWVVGLLLFILSCITFLPQPATPIGISHKWFYRDDVRAYEIIKSQNLENYNVLLPHHQHVAYGVKYFLMRDGVKMNYEDYRSNKYLFITHDKSGFEKYTTYEIYEFTPRKILKTWDINETYSLTLLERLPTN